jgi:hypothetical protein
MRVRDLMTSVVQVIAHDAPVESAAELPNRRHAGPESWWR